MLSIPDTMPIDLAPLASTIALPYTLTPGRAAGVFLAEIGSGRIAGSKFRGGTVIVPAQDFCPLSGESEFEFVEAPHTGTLTGFTETEAGIIALIKLDGSDVDFAHRILDATLAELRIGARVTAAFSPDVSESILAISGFRLTPGAPIGRTAPMTDPKAPVTVVNYKIALHYQHAFGPYYGRMFDELKTNRRFIGTRTPDGDGAFLPPREFCDVTHKRTGTWVTVKDTGTVRASSVIYLEFMGQKQPPPYIYAEIKLDGASTRLIHFIANVDMTRVNELVKPGARVQAVWSETRKGTLEDISHFELIAN